MDSSLLVAERRNQTRVAVSPPLPSLSVAWVLILRGFQFWFDAQRGVEPGSDGNMGGVILFSRK